MCVCCTRPRPPCTYAWVCLAAGWRRGAVVVLGPLVRCLRRAVERGRPSSRPLHPLAKCTRLSCPPRLVFRPSQWPASRVFLYGLGSVRRQSCTQHVLLKFWLSASTIQYCICVRGQASRCPLCNPCRHHLCRDLVARPGLCACPTCGAGVCGTHRMYSVNWQMQSHMHAHARLYIQLQLQAACSSTRRCCIDIITISSSSSISHVLVNGMVVVPSYHAGN